MLIKLHGIFAQDYGPEHRIEANTVMDAVVGLTRQLGFYSDREIEDRPLVRIVGVSEPEQFSEKTELNEIHLVPAMIGGGAFGKIVVGAAIVAVAITNPFGWAFLATTATAISVGSVGASLVLSGVMQLFMKAPKIKNSSDPAGSDYFALGDNSVEIGTPIAIQYGEGPVPGHVLAVNVDAKQIVTGTFPATAT